MQKLLAVMAVFLVAGASLTAYAADGGAVHASAALYAADGTFVGQVRFTEDAAGVVHVNAQVQGLTPGLHGIHLHAIGACAPTFTAAGGHHNPLGRQHGLENPGGAHSGDLPNLVVNVAGHGHLNASTDRASLSAGPVSVFDLDGSAVIIHAGADDQVTDPTGNSGGRIACGVIVND